MVEPSNDKVDMMTQGSALQKPVDSLGTPPPGPEVAKDAVTLTKGEDGTDTIQVQVVQLDKLMNLAGELVLIRNQVIQHAKGAHQTADFLNLAQRLSLLTSDLQNEVMKTRMQPIGNILNTLRQIVHGTAKDTNRSVDVQIEGADTELDKTLIEALKDPLTHLVQNAMDHGLELPEERKKCGKSATGQLKIQAFHDAGEVVIEIIDDGHGLERAKIGAKAIERGLITAQAFESMSDRDVHHLILVPGYSTTDKVVDGLSYSGGMEVVRRNVEKIGGVVDLISSKGRGTTVRLKIPLTLAIIPALIVRAAGERFAIPQIKLVELVRVEQSEDGSAPCIESLQGQPVFRLRGTLLPLVSLSAILHKEPANTGFAAAAVNNIIVLNVGERQFGLLVDDIEDSIDIVVKPLSNFLKSLNTYAGATVLGDGSIALTLDVPGLAEHVRLAPEDEPTSSAEGATLATEESLNNRSDYILLDIGSLGLYSVPIKQVKRLEELPASSIETAGEQRVVRYGDLILPILKISDKLGLKVNSPSTTQASDQPICVVVVEQNERLFGLEVQRILDIFSTQLPLDKRATDRPGILGSMIVEQQIVGVIDIGAMIGE
ncbi:MAG: chemotaxis protein CheA [Proteobacteria bacterium]|nr:chemotaxis protein CheA [Pseudomonadota bacterium]